MASKALNEYVLLGNSGLRVSPFCLGTMTWGTKWGIGSTKDDARTIFREFCAAGGNFIDTANKYNEGESEEWLGEFMAEAENRDELVIATKFSLPMVSNSKLPPPPGKPDSVSKLSGSDCPPCAVNHAGNSKKCLHISLKASLKRLQTDYVDIMYVHYWDWSTDTVELMRSLNDVVRSGKVLYLGISDAPGWVVAECNAIAATRGWTPFSVAQYRYSLADRTIERDVLNYSVNRNLPVVNWSVLGSGLLTGKFERDNKDAADSKRRDKGLLSFSDRDFDIVDVVKEVAAEAGCSPSQVAIAWARAQNGILSPLLGCRNVEQYRDNVGALAVKLSDDQLAKLDKISRTPLGFPLELIGQSVESCKQLSPAGKVFNPK